jgi:alpha/beta superfamily hydrolase/acyltransferase
MLVHLAATLDNWDPKLIDLLAKQQHVILLDLPGVGASSGKVATTIPGMAHQAIGIIEALGYDKVNLLGLSMGGMIAQEIARIDGEFINQLILVGTGPRAGHGIDKVPATTFRYILQAGLERIDPKRFLFYNHDAAGKREAMEVLDRLDSRPPEYADSNMTIPSFLRQLKAIKRWGQAGTDDLRFITQPTLIVNGDNDIMVPTKNSYDLHEKITHSKIIIYPHAGHGSLFQYADQFAEDLLAFLQQNA